MLFEQACWLATQIKASQMRGGRFRIISINKINDDPWDDNYIVHALDPYGREHEFRNVMQWQTWLGPIDDPINGPGRKSKS